MFKCSDCGRIFREPERWSELVVEFERKYYGCPRCGSEYYEDYYDAAEEEEEEQEDEEDC